MSADVSDVDEQHFGTQRCVQFRYPATIVERVNVQVASVLLVNVHHDKLHDSATKKKSRQNGLAFRYTGNDFVLLESKFCGGR